MAFFDKINSIAKSAGEKTSNAIEITKLNARIGKEKEKISAAKLAIGEIYYAKIAEGYELLPETAEMVETIRAAELAVEQAQGEIARIREGSGEEEEPTEASVKFCSACGTKCAAEAQFCSGCGNKF